VRVARERVGRRSLEVTMPPGNKKKIESLPRVIDMKLYDEPDEQL
jgi:hypothetical protein